MVNYKSYKLNLINVWRLCMIIRGWKLINEKRMIDIPADVPGDITYDLYRANVIPDPFYGLNHKQIGWVGETDFTYKTIFSVEEKILTSEEILLEFKGIDTFAEIYLNGIKLGETENMFRSYIFEVKSFLKKDGNQLTVRMLSTSKRMNEIENNDYFGVFNKKRLFIRKAQCHFGWDWAPDMPGYGIYKNVELYGTRKRRIDNVHYIADNEGEVTFFTDVHFDFKRDDPISEDERLHYIVSSLPVGVQNAGKLESYQNLTGAKNFVNFHIPSPQLWYPVGYGQQPLYSYRVELLKGNQVVDSKEGRFAFRSVKLLQKPKGEAVLGYSLNINGEDIFVKGSNWVPIECFTGIVKKEKYKKLIDLAKKANINMLRIWGGGIYEDDYLYDYCDEQGIMIWQDFMFACADIPEEDVSFVENVKQEIKYQIKRLRNHPALVYWCGGNEKTGSYGLQISHGDFLTDIVFRGFVENFDGTRPYARQSPCSYSDIGNDLNSGESHVNAFEACLTEGIKNYRKILSKNIPTFISECAIMGPGSAESFKRIFPTDKIFPPNEYWEDRLMDNPYAAILMTFTQRQVHYSKELYGESKNLDELICKGMTVHAEALRAEAEYARSNKGKTWGFLNWMYSDIWPSGTWSIVDYYTEPKQAYYQLKRSFAPVLATFTYSHEGKTEAVVINDKLEELSAEIEFGEKTLRGEIVWRRRCITSIKPNSVFRQAVEHEIKDRNTYLYIICRNGEEIYKNVYSVSMWSKYNFENLYKYRAVIENQDIVVTLQAETFVKGVTLRLPNNCEYEFTDNYVDMEAGEKRTIIIYGAANQINHLTVTDFIKECKG